MIYMTCKIEAGPGHQDHGSASLLCKEVKTFMVGDTQIDIETGGLNQPTKVYVIGGKLPVSSMVGKIKSWSSAEADLGFNLYGNGATVSLLSPEDPYHLEVINLPKGEV